MILVNQFFSIVIAATAMLTNSGSSNELPDQIIKHFEKYPPELYRYNKLATYGETQTRFESIQIEKELVLCNKVIASDMMNNPARNVFALCHNILIHSPEQGKLFLKKLNKPTTNTAIIGQLYIEFILAGEFGEQLALENLESEDTQWSKTWAIYLSTFGIYESSINQIERKILQTDDVLIKSNLISALMMISSQKSIETIKQLIETTAQDEVQARAIFACAELLGFDGIGYLQSIKPIDKKSEMEKQASVDWLLKETSINNKFGNDISNDGAFISRFETITSPVITWLRNENLLANQDPVLLTEEKKDTLLNLLIESKGFGLEAVKGHLFLSVNENDIEKLLMLRQACVQSPNNFSNSRIKSIGILIRYLRKSLK